MKANVFTDASFGADAGRFVWLSVNTERAVTAGFVKQFPFPAWPTFFVIDPRDQHVVLRWIGGMSIAQTHALLDEGAAIYHRPPASLTALDRTLRLADSLYAAGDNAGAGTAYLAALDQAPENWPTYRRTVESASFALSSADSVEAALRLVSRGLPHVMGTASELSLASTGLSMALELPKDDPRRAGLVAQYEKQTAALVAHPPADCSGDDIAGYYSALVDARDQAGDSLGVQKRLAEWAAFMETAIAAAPSPDARTVFDGNLVEVFHQLGTPEKAVPYLLANERDLPNDYNPAARLGMAYLYMKDFDKALAANDRAMTKVYGPRKLRVYTIRTDILVAKGDSAAAQATLGEAIAFAKALPDGQRSERQIAALEKRLATMQGGAH